MMSDYQKIRAAIEGPILTAFNSQIPPVPVYFDNITFVPPDPPGEYIRVNLTFGLMTETSLSDILDNARGALIIRCFSEKNKGPARCQELVSIASSVIKAISRAPKMQNEVFVKTFDLSGPSFPVESNIPHFVARVECSWMATLYCA